MKHFPPFRLDLVNECLWRKLERRPDERVPLTPKAFAVLRYLVEHAGQLVTHDQLLDEVWRATHVQPQAVKREILYLRVRTAHLAGAARKPKGGRYHLCTAMPANNFPANSGGR